mmetsp:Transcript_132289/g.263943  ORF Transcript_132289/g.263943 Transcript_132289/m.263943 type:complete len:205 (+) Transcript_132289:756-1370(+)
MPAHNVRTVVRSFPLRCVATFPHSDCGILGGREQHLSGRMEEHRGDLLGVADQFLHRFLCFAIEQDYLTVHATCQDAAVVSLVHIQAENARCRRLVCRVRRLASQPFHVSYGGEVREMPLLACPRQTLRNVCHALDDIGREAKLCLLTLGCRCGTVSWAHVLHLLPKLSYLSTRLIAISKQSRNDAAGSVMLIKRMGQLLACGV